MDLNSKTAFITGGASGLGLATARNFVASGANVFLYDLNSEALELAVAELGQKAAWHAGDVADENAVKQAIEKAKKEFGTIHINVNSAGIGGASRTVGKGGPMPLEKFEHIVRVNLIGTFNVLRLCAEVMQLNEPQTEDGERGVIINVASMLSFSGGMKVPSYAASKGGIVQFTKACASAWAADNIQVNAVLPGWIDTDLTRRGREEVTGLHERVLARTPAGRWGIPDDHAGVAIFLSGRGSDFVTGAAITVDGGFSIQA